MKYWIVFKPGVSGDTVFLTLAHQLNIGDIAYRVLTTKEIQIGTDNQDELFRIKSHMASCILRIDEVHMQYIPQKEEATI